MHQIEKSIKILNHQLEEHLECHVCVGFHRHGPATTMFAVNSEKSRRALITLLLDAVTSLQTANGGIHRCGD